MSRFLVLADDRTGALETAGGLAEGSAPITVAVHPLGRGDDDTSVRVVDLGSRHLDPVAAADVVRAALSHHRGWPDRVLLKMDSTLRGNWASDAVAIMADTGRPAVVVPAFPAAGRTCHRGVVSVDGRPVGDTPARSDARSPLGSSRPAERLGAAGATTVTEVATPRGLEEWLANRPVGFAVCDAVDDVTLDALGARWATGDGIDFVGTAGSIRAAIGAGRPAGPPAAPPRLAPPALVVVGSLHPAARAQVDRLAAQGWSVEVVDPGAATDPSAPDRRPDGDRLVLVSPQLAPGEEGSAEPARVLAVSAQAALASGGWGTVVIVGGDTAAAVLGDRPLRVEGLLAPGTPWGRSAAGSGPLVVTKPGGFGGPDALAALFARSGEPA